MYSVSNSFNAIICLNRLSLSKPVNKPQAPVKEVATADKKRKASSTSASKKRDKKN
jgi:hypothetical protein